MTGSLRLKNVQKSVVFMPTESKSYKYLSILGRIVGVVRDDRVYMIGDHVVVSDDEDRTVGHGRICGIRQNNSDHFFEVQMDNGESDTVKSARIRVVNDFFI